MWLDFLLKSTHWWNNARDLINSGVNLILHLDDLSHWFRNFSTASTVDMNHFTSNLIMSVNLVPLPALLLRRVILFILACRWFIVIMLMAVNQSGRSQKLLKLSLAVCLISLLRRNISCLSTVDFIWLSSIRSQISFQSWSSKCGSFRSLQPDADISVTATTSRYSNPVILLVELEIPLHPKVEASLGIQTLKLTVSLKLSQVELHWVFIVRRELQNVINWAVLLSSWRLVVVPTLAEKVLLLVLSTVVWYLMSSNLKFYN